MLSVDGDRRKARLKFVDLGDVDTVSFDKLGILPEAAAKLPIYTETFKLVSLKTKQKLNFDKKGSKWPFF